MTDTKRTYCHLVLCISVINIIFLSMNHVYFRQPVWFWGTTNRPTALLLVEGILFDYTVDSRYLEFDGIMENIRVGRSSTREELRKYRKCSLFNDKRETTRAKFWRAKTSIACPDSRKDFKLIRCFCCCFISLLQSLNLVERLITSRYLFCVYDYVYLFCLCFSAVAFIQ